MQGQDFRNLINPGTEKRRATAVLESPAGNRNIPVIQESQFGIGMDDITTARVRISPNPVKETTRVTVPGLPPGAEKTISLYDLTGRMVFSDHFLSREYRFSRGTLASGIYMLKVTGPDGAVLSVAKIIFE